MKALVATTLALRDVQLPPAPDWWPLAPGWWVVIGLLLLPVILVVARRLRRALRLRRLGGDFDHRLQSATTPVAQVALSAELLRRAALAVDASTAALQGEAWLSWLDGGRDRGFVRGPGRLLLDGAYRPAVDAGQAAALLPLARVTWARLRLEAGA